MNHEFSQQDIEEYLKMTSKAIVAYAFRNTFLEDIHAGEHCPTCYGNLNYSRITDEEMKKLMKESVNKMYTVLKLQLESKDGWKEFMNTHLTYVNDWDEPILEEEEFKIFINQEFTSIIKKMHNGDNDG